MATEYEMIRLFRRELELCALRPDETMIVLTEGDIRADYARAFMFAAHEIGATAFQLGVLPRIVSDSKNHTGRTPLAGNQAVIDAAKQADIVIDLIGLLFSQEQNEITASGTRMLMVREPFEILRQMFPDKDLRRRIEFGEQLLRTSKHLHITSPAGTDVTYLMGDYPVLTQYGYVDTPGRWDHFATGQVLSQACDGKVDGRIVIMPGDLITDFRRYVEQPVTLEIEGGYVREISGPGMDAHLLRDYMASFDDPRAYAISHIGWGLHKNAKWFHNAATRTRDLEVGVNSLSFYGNVLFSTGPNTELGGTNDTACHVDIPLRNATLVLDGRTIVKDGDIAFPEMQA
jgi:2,5-dihydroxypyridine 5,6-dioxygenase